MAEAPGAQPAADPPPAASRQPGLRHVLLVGAVVVAVVLAAAALTALLPREAQGVVFHTPLLIGVLIVGTGLVLWRILRRPPG
jgi:FtsH-binding integral membrane protein